ncbi:MAG TPA: MerR family transcriptional regulator [Jatrophihabitans sp.]|nr:MerR family transcriptional regulator [Jatrophihabitans sp.]
MNGSDGLPVGQVSRLTGVTVRTLHHYDQVGLLVPADRSTSGYRLYGKADLDRLNRILTYRELGFGLDEIAELLDSDADLVGHLRRQRALVAQRIERLRAVAGAIERELEAHRMNIQLTPEEQFEIFGPDYQPGYAAEAEQRWGDTEAYRQSQRRVAGYDKDDWRRIKAESEANEQQFARLLRAGSAADSPAAMDAAEAHRQHIIRWFNDVPVAMHRGLAQLYLSDDRFAAHYDRVEPGLARFVSAAILANAERRQD